YGNVTLDQQRFKVENNNILMQSQHKPENYIVNIFVSTFIGDVEVVYR
ncbi:transporter, partial [Staphylococcus pseudintermedius]